MSDATRAALEELEAEWRRLGVPVQDVLAPGLSEDAVRAGLAALTSDPPESLVAWFGWHNGNLGSQPWRAAPLACWPLVSLDRVIAVQKQLIRVATDLGEEGPDIDPAWLPIADAGPFHFAVDVGSGELLLLDWWSEVFARVVAPDLASAVSMWTNVLRSDRYVWSASRWHYDFAALPMEVRASGLVG